MNPLLPFEWVLATRFLREGLLQTLFIIAGVALGVSVIVFVAQNVVVWPAALTMMAGAALGGFAGAHKSECTRGGARRGHPGR